MLNKLFLYGNSQLFRYLITGTINSGVGFGVIVVLMLMQISPQWSNMIGYICGLFISFILNRQWVFKYSKGKLSLQVIRFMAMFLIAFSVNFCILNWLLIVNINMWVAQIIAAIFYTVIFYVLNKKVVFT